jgi:hypothetical protein
MRRTSWVTVGFVALTLAANDDPRRPIAEAWAQAGVVVPQPVPSGYDFPTDAATING